MKLLDSAYVLDIKLIFLTIQTIVNRQAALKNIQGVLLKMQAEPQFIEVAGRELELVPFPPPGANEIVQSY